MKFACALLLLVGLFAGVVIAADKFPLTDNLLYDRVRRRLANDRELKTTAIDIEVKDKIVTLQGTVESEKHRQRAETVVRKTEGVKKVVNELKVRP